MTSIEPKKTDFHLLIQKAAFAVGAAITAILAVIHYGK